MNAPPPPRPLRTLHTVPFRDANSVLHNLRIRIDESPPYITYELDFVNATHEQTPVPEGILIDSFSRTSRQFFEQPILPCFRVYVFKVEDGARVAFDGKMLFWKAPGEEL